MAFIPHLVIVTPNIVDDNPADDTLTVRRDKHDGDVACFGLLHLGRQA